MNCETIDANLDDWLDGLLDEARAQAFEAHLGECAACAARAERARTLLAAAHRLPPEIPPSRDLWPGIAARLEAPAAPRRRQPAWFRALAASVAAAGIFMAGMLANQVLENRPAQDALVTERPAPRLPDVEQARNLLPASYVELVEGGGQSAESNDLLRNLLVVNLAIRDVERALAEDPDNARLGELLTALYSQEARILSRAERMRSGRQVQTRNDI